MTTTKTTTRPTAPTAPIIPAEMWDNYTNFRKFIKSQPTVVEIPAQRIFLETQYATNQTIAVKAQTEDGHLWGVWHEKMVGWYAGNDWSLA
jgi:hypothetical protein